MKLTLLILIFFPFLLSALELELHPSKDYTTTPEEVNSLIYQASQQRMRVSNKEAKHIIEQNRILADEYLRTTKDIEKELKSIQMSLEQDFSRKMMKKILADNPIEEDVLKSYYYDKKEKFKLNDSIDIDFYICSTFEQALEVYRLLEKNKINKNFLDDRNITKQEGRYKLTRLDKQLQDYIQENPDDKLLPPMYFFDHFTVSYINDISDEYTRTYEEAKPIIINILNKALYEKKEKSYVDQVIGR